MLFVMQHCLCAVLMGKGSHRQCIQLYESCDQINVLGGKGTHRQYIQLYESCDQINVPRIAD